MKRLLLLVVMSVLGVPAVAAADSAVPYQDDRVAGHLAFCDAGGRVVTGGTLTDAPFAAKVVSDYVPPAPNDEKGSAFVLAFQPRQGVAPGAWSGEQLTASSSYTDRTHPSAEVTYGDVTLLQASQDYPPSWDGLLQLRMYSKAPQQPAYSARYAAADVRISRGRWQVVDPVTLPCASGTAASVARVLAPDSVRSPGPTAGNGGSSQPAATPAAPRATAEAGAAQVPSHPAAQAPGTSSRGGGRGGWVVGVSLLAVLLASAGGLAGWRRLNSS